MRLGPCRAVSLARQRSPRVACLYHTCISYRTSLYRDIQILLLQTRQDAPCMSYGQGAFRLAPTSVLPHAPSMSIVQRLEHRALTGRGLGVVVHQHYGFRMHLELKGAFGSRSFERRLPDYKSLTHFCTTLIDGYPEWLCACVLVREVLTCYGGWDYGGRYDLLCKRLEMCAGALLYVLPCVRGHRLDPRQIKEGYEERPEAPPSCGCTITTSEDISKY